MPDSKTPNFESAPHSEFPVPSSAFPLPRSELRVPRSRVLVVDDEESIRVTLAEFIKDDQYTVDTAADADEALRLMDEHAFDVVVTDIVLPRMNGVDLMTEIRKRSPDTQVIMLTGDPTVETAAEAVRAGAFDYLTKPVSQNAIRRVVANAAQVKLLNDEKRALQEEKKRYQEHLEELIKERTNELQKSEAHYRGIVQYQTECIDRWLPDGTLTFVNDAYCRFYGKSREELIGYNWIESVTREDRDQMRAYVEKLKETVTPADPAMTSEHRELVADGEVRWMQWTDQAIFDDHGNLVEFQSVGRDITERKIAQEAEERLLQQQIAINKLSLVLGSFTSLQDIYDTIYHTVCELIETDAFYISSYDGKQQIITAEYVRDEYGHMVDPTTLPPLKLERPGHGTQSQVIRSGKPMYIPDILQAMENIEQSYNIDSDGTVTRDTIPYAEQENITRSELLAPMLFRGEVIGVIGVQSIKVDAYAEADLELLSGLANVAVIAIKNTYLQEGLKKTLADTIRVVGLATEIRDPYTAKHQERVAKLACAIARKMGLLKERIEGLNAAGLLHDIGKMSVPAEILTKPSKLSDLEFKLIRRHPEVGYDILKDIDFPWPVADIVLQHHERMNGSGYPNGLNGEEILLEARILGVADVVEAMASHRPYRSALGITTALDEIKQGKGRLYDPSVVDACLAVFEKGFSFE